MPKTVYDCCAWVKGDGKSCKKPTQWKMVKDDDGRMVRKYEPFCPEHTRTMGTDADDDWDLGSQES